MDAIDPAVVEIFPFGLDQILGLSVGLHPLEKRSPVAQAAVQDVSVAAFSRAKIAGPVQAAGPPVNSSHLMEEASDVLDRGGAGFLDTDIDPLALAGALAGKQRS